MYQAMSSVSEKIKLEADPLSGTTFKSHSLLYIQVPFRVLIASNVTLIIKVFKNVKSSLPNEANKVWLSGRPTDITLTRNILKKYEGFALINFSDTFWKHKAKCGQVFMPAVQFY